MNVRVKATNKVTSAVPVEKPDVFMYKGVVKVFAEVAGNTFAEYIEDCRAYHDTNRSYLKMQIINFSHKLKNKKGLTNTTITI